MSGISPFLPASCCQGVPEQRGVETRKEIKKKAHVPWQMRENEEKEEILYI